MAARAAGRRGAGAPPDEARVLREEVPPMATVMGRAPAMAHVSRVARRGYRLLLQGPSIPLAILAFLTLVAILAPILAPHGKLDPVKPTPEQCQVKYNTANCPYVDNAPPFWLKGGTFETPLGTDFLGRDVLSRLMYGA